MSNIDNPNKRKNLKPLRNILDCPELPKIEGFGDCKNNAADNPKTHLHYTPVSYFSSAYNAEYNVFRFCFCLNNKEKIRIQLSEKEARSLALMIKNTLNGNIEQWAITAQKSCSQSSKSSGMSNSSGSPQDDQKDVPLASSSATDCGDE